MSIVLKLLWVIIISGLGGLAYALAVNIMVMSGLLSGDGITTSFGVEMTQKAVMVWLVCVPLSIWASFMQSKMRYILLLMPLYMPSVFALFYTLMNKGAAAG